MKYANKINAQFSCIIGDNEIKSGKVQLKNMMTSQTIELNLKTFVEDFVKTLNN